MSLYRRGRTWWCEWQIAGSRTRESTGTTDRQAAQEYHDRRRAELWRSDRLGEVVTTWDEAALIWLEEHACHKRSAADDRLRLRAVTAYLSERDIAGISADDILLLRRRIPGANATKNRHLAVVSAVLHYARARGKLLAVPKIPYLREPKGRFHWLTREQARALLAELPPHLAALAQFALATGLRRANVTGLRWDAVDIRRRVAWIWPDAAKNGQPLGVPLNDDAIAVLRRQRGQHREWVFTYRGGPITETTTRAFKLARQRAGIADDFTWHDLRHTWASWHVMGGTPLNVLQQLGGWKDHAMVLRYAHLAPSYVAQYAEAVALDPPKSPHTTKTKARAKRA